MLHIFSELNLHVAILLIIALSFVLFYEAINGFHDTANAVATVIYTRAMRDKPAVMISGIFNFLGVILGGLSVAYAVVHLLPTDLLLNISSTHGLVMVFAILLAAIIWNLGTWYFGIPASSSHTLIGSIIGAALINAWMNNTSLLDALNLHTTLTVFAALIISPFVGLILAGSLMYVLHRFWNKTKKQRRIHMTPAEREKKDGKKKPPFWIRIMLILSAIGVSFSHGANDGQKGIGVLMLVLMGVAPAGFIVNMNASPYDISRTYDAVTHLEQFYQQNPQVLSQIHIEQPTRNEVTKDEYYCHDTLKTLGSVQSLLKNVSSYDQLSVTQRSQARRALLCISDTAKQVAKLPSINHKQQEEVQSLRKDLLHTVEYAPLFVIFGVALAISIGTMIGWRRVAVTIGEKIGKKGMTYAQGFSAQVTSAFSIGLASYTGMPVSTTHVLSSAIAGTMLVSGGGLQSKTVKNILIAWILTFPAAMLLSAGIYWILFQFI